MNIPFVDLKAQKISIKYELKSGFLGLIFNSVLQGGVAYEINTGL